MEYADQYCFGCDNVALVFLLSLMIGLYITLRFCAWRLGRLTDRRRPIIREVVQDDGPWEVVTSVPPVTPRGLCTFVMEEAQGLRPSELVPSVDWKSLTIPASLPITTDFLPDKWTLDNDYTVCPYTLLPDDVNSDYLSNPPINEDERYFRKKPLTVQQVFQEIISQRLSQGFQIIITKKPSSSRPDLSLSPSPQYQHTSKLIRGRPRQEYQEEYFLSIGLIFHKLTMSGQNIQVTRYRPRHESPQMTQLYRYRFQVPDSHSYDVSTSEFKNEKLENYNWNYLDQYICTRGEADYGLIPSLKFWRSRFFLLPSNNLATKKIIEGSDNQKEQEVLHSNLPHAKLIEAMKDTQTGLPLLPKQTGLPEQSFISEEAVDWCMQNLQDIKTVDGAVALMQSLLDEQLICHGSENPRHNFIYGFYLYYIVPPKDKSKPEYADQYCFGCDNVALVFLLSLMIGLYITLRFCAWRLGRLTDRRRPIIREVVQDDGPWEVVTSVPPVTPRGLCTFVMEEAQGLRPSELVPSAR